MERAADALDRAGRTSEPEESLEEKSSMQHAVLDCSRSTKGKPFFLHAAKVSRAKLK